MKNILFFIALIFVGHSFAQINQVDSQGRKQGQWEKVYPGTRVYQYRGQFKDDKPVGRFVYFYKSSKKKAVIIHADDGSRSEAFYYHPNGVLMSTGIYRNYKKDSIWLNFGPSGRISNAETYKNDSLDGMKVVYYVPEELSDKSRIPHVIYNYKNGALDGETKEYHQNGNIKQTGQYANNKKVGLWIEYHPNGRKSVEKRYKDGLKHGWFKVYNPTGKLTNTQYYYYGKLLEGEELKEKLRQMKELGINPNG